jgi:uncharacterized protein
MNKNRKIEQLSAHPFQRRRRRVVHAVVAQLLVLVSPLSRAADPPGTDCPLARQPYSADTVLIDLLINPSTRAVLDQDLPNFVRRLPPEFQRMSPPSFAALLTPRSMAQRSGTSEAVLKTLDADLAAVRITNEAVLARCARYDENPPALPETLRPPAVLVFAKTNGFRDDASIDAARGALEAIGARNGWSLFFTDNGAVFNPVALARFSAVIWNNVSGDALTLTQQRSLKAYVTAGGGFVAIHGSGGDPYYVWDWYVDTLIGARFVGHPRDPQFQPARVIIDDPANPIVHGLKSWTMTEEWYSFKSSPRLRGAHILATLDESSYTPSAGPSNLRMGDHPIAWTQCLGDGRSFYTAIGHRPESYAEANSVTLLERGIAWSAGLGQTRCLSGRETSR